MAEVEFILQAITAGNHADAIRELFKLSGINRVIVSIAFVRESGAVEVVEEAIQPFAKNVDFFIGIRNDITTIQGVKRLLAMKVNLYAVDTASRQTIFHPKLYYVSTGTHAHAIIGSSNLTFSGLHNNIEVSTLVKLDLAIASDRNFAEKITNAFAPLLTSHPDHVFLIKNGKHADELFEAGRLADENVIPAPVTSSTIKKGTRDPLRPMKLHRKQRARRKVSVPVAPIIDPASSRTAKKGPTTPLQAVPALVWKSKELAERDLNIPRSGGTNPTGSMGWKKGTFEHIDQRHYFREEVFDDLNWKADAPPKKWERTTTRFELIIKNVNYGMFDLKLSHNTNIKSRTYKQNNFMTQLHWGAAKEHIAKRDLLGRTLYLYKKNSTPPEFVIEID